MDLKEELERLRKLRSDRILEALDGKIHRADAFFARKEKEEKKKKIDDILPNGSVVQTPYGEVIRNEIYYETGSDKLSPWMSLPWLEFAAQINPSHLVQLSRDADFRNININEIAFVDVETTGLAGGTGTYPFLIGVGYFGDTAFNVEQFFMEDYHLEPALMHQVAERVKAFKALVTYNGKTFDLPLLRTRFIFNRLPSVWEKPHIDILYLARRLWRKRLPDCSLGSVEKEVLKIKREMDIDGSFVPRIYFDYTRGVRREMILPVFAHNAQDVASIGALLLRFAYYLDNPECDELCHAFDLIGLSRIYEMNGLVERAVDAMERALLYAREDYLSHLISGQIAKIYKRQQRWSEAVEIWHTHISSTSASKLESFVELAKYYEHREKNYQKASAIVEKALKHLNMREELAEFTSSGIANNRVEQMIEALNHRLNRLRKKKGKLSPSND
jgi:uncharacterized protein YprB with RNaseH-like and TPR domain